MPENTMHASDYTSAAGDLAVLVGAIAIPDHVAAAAAKIYFGKTGQVLSQEVGMEAEIYSAIGTVGMHCDNGYEEETSNATSLGLVILNESGCCLTDGEHILPLPVGSVFRHHPDRMHGTCLPDGSRSEAGKLVFLSYTYHTFGSEDRPQDFAAWALPDAEAKLEALLPEGELRYPMQLTGR